MIFSALWILIGLVVAIAIVRYEFNHSKDLLERRLAKDSYTFLTYVLDQGKGNFSSFSYFTILFVLLCIAWPYSLYLYKKELLY